MSNQPANTTREIRIQSAPQKFEIRKNNDGSRSITGYAATFGDLSQDLGGFVERIQKGAFSQSLKVDNPDVLCLYSHDDSQILGRVSSGTLQIAEDDKGLRFTCKLPDTSTARDLIALMERLDVSQMSFGFAAIKDNWSETNGQTIRTLIQVILYEVSVVGSPAYLSTSVDLRSAPASIKAKLKRNDSDRSEDDACDEYEDISDCPVCSEESEEYDPELCETNSLRRRLRAAEQRIAAEANTETDALRQRIANAISKVL